MNLLSLLRFGILAIFVVAALSLTQRSAARSEAACYVSPRAVWDDHPHAHAAWRLIDGQQCWRVGYPSHANRGRRGGDGKIASAPPLPRTRPELELLYPHLYPRLSPADGVALSRELLGETR